MVYTITIVGLSRQCGGVLYTVESNMTAVLGEAASFVARYEFKYLIIVAPSNFDRLILGYRLNQTALLGNLYCPPITERVST